jgi:hypothetical protein
VAATIIKYQAAERPGLDRSLFTPQGKARLSIFQKETIGLWLRRQFSAFSSSSQDKHGLHNYSSIPASYLFFFQEESHDLYPSKE